MAGQTTDSGLITQAIGRYFSYRLLVIPAVALLMVMAAYVALRSNRVYGFGASDAYINIGQGFTEIEAQGSGGYAFIARDTSTPRGGGQQTGFSYAVQGNDEEVEVAGAEEGYSNVSAMTASYTYWGGEDNGILSAFLGHLKKGLPKVRVYHPADQVVAGASEA